MTARPWWWWIFPWVALANQERAYAYSVETTRRLVRELGDAEEIIANLRQCLAIAEDPEEPMADFIRVVDKLQMDWYSLAPEEREGVFARVRRVLELWYDFSTGSEEPDDSCGCCETESEPDAEEVKVFENKIHFRVAVGALDDPDTEVVEAVAEEPPKLVWHRSEEIKAPGGQWWAESLACPRSRWIVHRHHGDWFIHRSSKDLLSSGNWSDCARNNYAILEGAQETCERLDHEIRKAGGIPAF